MLVLKKPGLDATNASSYRPISNLSVLSKLLERLVARQLMEYLSLADLIPPLQSGFRRGYSTTTAVLRVLSDILQAVDRGDLAALVFLDLSAAFDTVGHSILLERCNRPSVLATQPSVGFSRTCRPGLSTCVEVPTSHQSLT